MVWDSLHCKEMANSVYNILVWDDVVMINGLSDVCRYLYGWVVFISVLCYYQLELKKVFFWGDGGLAKKCKCGKS